MRQYCRYCQCLEVGDANYCSSKERCLSESAIRKPNRCKDFMFCEWDAINPGEIYHPHTDRDDEGQESFDLDASMEGDA